MNHHSRPWKLINCILMLYGKKFLNVVFQNSFGAMPAKPKRLLHNMSRQQNNVVSASAYSRVGWQCDKTMWQCEGITIMSDQNSNYLWKSFSAAERCWSQWWKCWAAAGLFWPASLHAGVIVIIIIIVIIVIITGIIAIIINIIASMHYYHHQRKKYL